MNNHAEELIERFALQKHPEGGWFSEVFETSFQKDKRAMEGSIYFLLNQDEISHFHVIDCDEIWYYHEGCGMNVLCIDPDGKFHNEKLGMCIEKGEQPMVVIRAGTVFAAENKDQDGYTFVSCATTPQFTYEGFHLCTEDELMNQYPDLAQIIRKYCIR